MKVYLSIILIITYVVTHAQSNIKGRVIDSNQSPIPFINIIVSDTQKYAVSDKDGFFSIEDLKNKVYTLRLSAIGFKTSFQTIDLSDLSSLTLEFKLYKSTENLDEVILKSKSQIRVLNEQPLAISSIDVQLFQNLNIDAASLLDRTNGLRVRQSGGLGSDVNISIQGAQGNAIRRYYDGLPIKFLAAGLDINNLPVNQIERIDIYRGVTPLEVGTDALGGGINIIPKKFKDTYVDMNYQFGSFNTHRPSVNLFYVSDNNVFIGSNFFINYSDNNYKIDAQDFDVETRSAQNIIEAERFHDRYRSYYADFSVGIQDQPWAEELKATIIYNNTYDEVQNGVQFDPVRAAGEIYNTTDGFTSILNYSVKAFNDKLAIATKTNFGVYEEKIKDSTAFFYNWSGTIIRDTNGSPITNERGTDLLGGPADISIDREILLQRTTVSYAFSPSQKITLSNLFIDQQREGRNAFLAEEDDPFRFPASLQQNYAGIEWSAKWFHNKLESVATYKNYQNSADATSLESIATNDAEEDPFERREVSNSYSGGNVALKYTFTDNFFIRSSFEYAYRLPEENELFGNQTTIRSNINLRPEQSDNINVGLFYKTNLFKDKPLAIEINSFYRYQRDRIVLLASGFDLAQFFNEEEVEIAGVDGYIAFKPVDHLKINLAATFQDIRIRKVINEADASLLGTRLFNVPYWFASFDATYSFHHFLAKKDQLTLSYFYDFVEEFSSVREANVTENVENFVPTQHINSLEAIYTTPSKQWNFSARINNIFNDDVYDNFRVQRPGTNFTVKLRYVIQ
ncbi:TonB-dependent receptor [Aquimarina sp. U1-2]|uniref:TonB-dependent receptor n=1 Tax=Aquimarina sp. U1-2 TaxID=2823141 RepID=UPI001AECE25D|nr:TonB-dependent receptor [Aquimarina sp. U1-2]MBP2832385.1 TonB-dependent receptor [Aquimarina sp. U1-2]